MQVFGRDLDNMEVMAADFLPMNKQLYIISADGDCDLHVFQYDPESKSSQSWESYDTDTIEIPNLHGALNCCGEARSTLAISLQLSRASRVHRSPPSL